jgi:hypothetical protein
MSRERADTLAEVAERYRFTERWLRDFIRKHNIPVFHTGKLIRFDALAIAALEEALRRPCSKSSDAPIPAVSKSKALSRDSAFDRLLKLRQSRLREKKRPHSKLVSSESNSTADSKIVPIGHSPRSQKPI